MAKISLALSGSGFKFPVHVGALRAVLDSNHELEEIAGTSGGSIVAAMWACEMSIDEIVDVVLEKDWKPYVKLQLRALLKGGINSGDMVLEFCRDITKGRKFSEIPRHISIVSTDLLTNDPFIFNKEETPHMGIADAVRASISIPVLFAPYRFHDKLLVDGVVSNSLPMNHLFTENSIKVGVKIHNTGPEYPAISVDSGPFSIARRALYHLVDKQDDWAFESGHFGHLLNVDTAYARGLDPNHPREVRIKLMKDGYEAMKNHIDLILGD